MDITRNMNGARALVVGAGLALALAMGAAPTPAMAAGRVGTTKVMVRTEIDNVNFKVPTVIPFVAKAGGTLQGPSEDATTIDNLSAYGIHVTNMKIDAMNTWTIAADAKTGSAQNSIDFKVGFFLARGKTFFPIKERCNAPYAEKLLGTPSYHFPLLFNIVV